MIDMKNKNKVENLEVFRFYLEDGTQVDIKAKDFSEALAIFEKNYLNNFKNN